MNKLAKRAWFALVLAGILLCGMLVIVFRYVTDAEQWVAFRSNPAVQKGGALSSYSVCTRDNVELVNTDGKVYCDDAALRSSVLHLLGDGGNTPSYLTNAYGNALTGFDYINGIYSTSDAQGKMTLTVSSLVQRTAYNAMEGKKGTVGVYNYQTGEILCMLSMPTYDIENPPQNIFQLDEDGNRITDSLGNPIEKEEYEGLYYNRFVRSLYIPGSTFKLVTAAAAIDKIADIDERTFECKGSAVIGGRVVNCQGGKAHGTLSFEKALSKSCNVVFAQVAVELGEQILTDYANRVRITESLTFDGITTKAGSIKLSQADEHAIAWAGIGQNYDQINACQFMAFVGAIANGGSSATPYVVMDVTYGDDVEYTAQTTSESYLSSTTANRLAEMMRYAAKNNYAINGYTFAGLECGAKSGTAELGNGKSDALFAGFSSDPNYPLAFVVIVEDGGSGSKACRSIVDAVLNACVAAMNAE